MVHITLAHKGNTVPPLSSSLDEYSNYLVFVSNCVSSFQNEHEFEARNGQIIHLLDFQEVRAYLAPLLRLPSDKSPNVAKYFRAANYFSLAQDEATFLPLGSIAELSKFITNLASQVARIKEVLASKDIHGSLERFQEYFEAEKFTDRRLLELLPSSTVHGQENVLQLHSRAVSILSHYEQALVFLKQLLERHSEADLPRVLSRFPAPFSLDRYTQIRQALHALRRRRRSNNQIDAFNVAFVLELNDHFASLARRPEFKGKYFFKLLTDTDALYRLRNEPSIQITYNDLYGLRLRVIDRIDHAVYKRALRRYCELKGFREVLDFRDRVEVANTSISRLREAARENGLDPDSAFRSIFQNELDEKAKERNYTLAKSLELPVRRLCEFMETERKIVSLVASSEQTGWAALPSRQIPTAGSASGVAVSVVQSLMSDVRQLARLYEYGDLAPKRIRRDLAARRGPLLNPAITFEKLGYEIDVQRQSFALRQIQNSAKEVVIRFEDGVFSGYWPTVLEPAKTLLGIQETLESLNTDPEAEVGIREIDRLGRSNLYGCAVKKIAKTPVPNDLAFIRVDSNSCTFTSEFFARPAGYVLKTGVLMQELDLKILWTAVDRLSRLVIGSQILQHSVKDWLNSKAEFQKLDWS